MSAKLRDKYMPFVFMDLSGPVAVSQEVIKWLFGSSCGLT